MKLVKNKIFSLLGFVFIVSSLFALDIITKMVAQKNYLIHFSPTDVHNYYSNSLHVFTIGGPKNWLEFSLTYVRNTGAAWGFLGTMNESIRPYFFNTITFIAIALIIVFFRQTPKDKLLPRFGLILILSGACGNFFDRLFFHYVIDWLHVRWSVFSWSYDFPVFNIADSCVTSGVTLLIIDMILSERKRNKNGTTTIPKELHK